MKKIFMSAAVALACSMCFANCSDNNAAANSSGQTTPSTPTQVAQRNLTRSMDLAQTAFTNYFSGDDMRMARFYNPYTGKAEDETASVWMYTAAIEAVNNILEALQNIKGTNAALYQANWDKYTATLQKLYNGMEYYAGTFTLTSYTQTRQWTVYGVNRAGAPGTNDVTGVLNVYDDQQWLVHELVKSYKLTGSKAYLDKAEYLTAYVLDGWDCTLDKDGHENGGITWGPGYISKHSCSNGPMVSPLVELYQIYKGKADNITYRNIAADGSRQSLTTTKEKYYLDFARKVYAWQKDHLLDTSRGVYFDMCGGEGNGINYETIKGVKYRAHNGLQAPGGKAWSYNSGTMLSGCADLYRATGQEAYLADVRALTGATFGVFAQKDANVKGYYTYPVEGFSTWFNDVLLRGYLSAASLYNGTAEPIASYQANLDYAYEHFLYKGMLPTNLLVGWNMDKANNKTEGMFAFTYASEYAQLATNQLANNK